ncbi:fibronectin type III domain-containing protein [Actinokineospora pegani]|uniref:fibronectin type III domain-containing protein n=1 Tax=Actinokineospora pegani TaxID=2654637 RepID=UPI0012E9A2F8|nr:fibronectin type III domain-containing protein [Actinokineospora pegani]
MPPDDRWDSQSWPTQDWVAEPAGATEPPPPRRGPRLGRRLALIGLGLALVGGAVVALRSPGQDRAEAPEPPSRQVSVSPFAGAGVVVPRPGARPGAPELASIDQRADRAVLRWEPVEGAAGYDVRWGIGTSTTGQALTARPAAQINAMAPGSPYAVQVRSVDAFGQRSAPLVVVTTPGQDDDPTPWSYRDDFTSRVLPDPVGWRLTSAGDCGRATRGEGGDSRRVVVSARCGPSESVALRARTPLRLNDSGELGRVVVETDHLGAGGALLVDLVPGPVDLPAEAPGATPGPGAPGQAQEDAALAPGAVRVKLSPSAAQVLVAPGTPRAGVAARTQPIPAPLPGVTARWEVVLGADGVRVLRDGVVVGGGEVVPAWREATVLLGFAGGPDGLHAGLDLVGFVGAATSTPVLAVPPVVDAGRAVAAGASQVGLGAGVPITNARGGQVRVVLVPERDAPVAYQVEVGGQRFPARPAVAGQPHAVGTRYPVVADVPAAALAIDDAGRLRAEVVAAAPGARVLSASIELVPLPGAVSPLAGSGTDGPLSRSAPLPPRPSARFLNAEGVALPAAEPVPRGRLIVEVGADGAVPGDLAGLAGIEVRLDGELLAGVPTAVDGPGTGGTWRIALPTSGLATGGHALRVSAVSTRADARVAETEVVFELAE